MIHFFNLRHIPMEKLQNTANYKLYLLRHFPTELNIKGVIVGQSDVYVSKDIAANFDFVDIPQNINEILCSPLQRCIITANRFLEQYQICYNQVPTISIVSLLTERNMGDWEGRPKEYVIQKNGSLFKNGYMIPYITPPNGESLPIFISRGEKLLNTIFDKLKNENLVICAHNQILKLLAHLYFKDTSLSNWGKINFKHGRLVDLFSSIDCKLQV